MFQSTDTYPQPDATARFDWYAATIREDPQALLRRLADNLGGEVVNGKPKQGYARGDFIRRDGSTIVTVYSGGRNGHPHAFASGDDADEFVPLVRALYGPTHHVTRMDAAIDFDGPGTWDRLFPIVRDLALGLPFPGDPRRRVSEVSVSQSGDWLRPVAGRTFYVGSFKSAVLVRLYEKGKQLRGLAVDGGADISEDLVRLEVQVRPEQAARFKAASSAPVDAFGYADWSRELLRRVTAADVPRVHIRERRESDHERAMHWLITQYGEHLATEAEAVGGWDMLARSLQRRVMLARDERPEGDPDDLLGEGRPF